MHPLLRYVGGALTRHRLRRQARQFFDLTRDPQATQERVLRELLALNAGTEFARSHHFEHIRTVADFRRQIPITDYEYYRPYVERLKQGEHAALLGANNRLRMFTLTSGTTSAAKFIPITDRFLDDYRRGWKTWGIRAYDDHPRLHVQDIVQLCSDYDQFRTPAGHPCGNISGLVSAMQSPVVKLMYTIPDCVTKISDPVAKYYTALRLAVATRSVGLVTTANPSTLIHFARLGDEHRAELIRDIADGTLSSKFEISAPIRKALRWEIGRRRRQRARELEQIVHRTGQLLPQHYWPEMSLVAVWTGGSAGAYLEGLRRYYGSVPVRDHGLSASEGRMTIPFADDQPAGVLDIGSHYFEFVPVEEIDSAQPTVLGAHELTVGADYYILLTTSSGLCRYNIRDVVRCTGFADRTPLLEFLNKGAHIASLTGEKITESQVVQAVREACRQLQLQFTHFTLTPVWGDPPGYRLLLEESDLSHPALGAQLTLAVEQSLQTTNCEYAEKRRTGRLVPLTLELIPAGTWQRFCRQRQSRLGGSIEQYKHPCLIPDLQFLDTFRRDFIQTASPDSGAAVRP